MAFTFLIVGAILLVSAVRDQQSTLFGLVKGDLTGANNYIFWMLSILAIGAVGYIPRLKPISIAFLTLVVIVLIVSRGDPSKAGAGGGLFQKLSQALNVTTQGVTTGTVTTYNI